MQQVHYGEEEAFRYSQLSVQGEGTVYLAFRDLKNIIQEHFGALPKQALDYGCGAGRSTLALKKLGIETVGVDISFSMLSKAKETDQTGKYILVESAKIPEKDCVFELSLLSFVTLTIDKREELEKVFKEVARVTQIGGQVIVITLSDLFWGFNYKWLSYEHKFPENRNPVEGQRMRLVLKPIQLELQDYFWTNCTLVDIAKKAHLIFKRFHFPLGQSQEAEWLSEKDFSPYVLISFEKTA